MTAGIRVIKPVDVVDAPDLTITEYVGRVASADSACSACVATVRTATKELPQCPSFDEFVLVLEGEVHIMHGANLTECTIVRARGDLWWAGGQNRGVDGPPPRAPCRFGPGDGEEQAGVGRLDVVRRRGAGPAALRPASRGCNHRTCRNMAPRRNTQEACPARRCVAGAAAHWPSQKRHNQSAGVR